MHNPDFSTGQLVYAISVDLCGSTKRGLALPTYMNDRFNHGIMCHLDENLSKLDLATAITKCTGDGWLVMTEVPESIFALCALAIILREGFKDALHELTGIPGESIPLLRICIGAGRDIRVVMPDKRTDWMGDSARRTVRMEQLCMPGEILVCEQIRSYAAREFHFQALEVDKRVEELGRRRGEFRWEEEFPVWILKELCEQYFPVDSTAGDITQVSSPQWHACLLDELRRRRRAGRYPDQLSEAA